MRQPRSQIALTAIAIMLGLLVVIQFRAQQAGTGLGTQSSQDLTLLIANLTTRNDQLRGEVADIGRQLDAIAAANARGETSVGQLRGDLERVRIWSGQDAATGPGIRVLLFGGVPAEAISDLVNELRNAGAEGIAVGGVRVSAGTITAGPVGGLSIANTALGPRIEVLAIGNPPVLTGGLTRAGGLVAQLQARYAEVLVEVTPLDSVALPAADRSLAPILGVPRP
ncbi:MAG: DUF881 domain-containing protein [Chloroflexota bacterium]